MHQTAHLKRDPHPRQPRDIPRSHRPASCMLCPLRSGKRRPHSCLPNTVTTTVGVAMSMRSPSPPKSLPQSLPSPSPLLQRSSATTNWKSLGSRTTAIPMSRRWQTDLALADMRVLDTVRQSHRNHSSQRRLPWYRQDHPRPTAPQNLCSTCQVLSLHSLFHQTDGMTPATYRAIARPQLQRLHHYHLEARKPTPHSNPSLEGIDLLPRQEALAVSLMPIMLQLLLHRCQLGNRRPATLSPTPAQALPFLLRRGHNYLPSSATLRRRLRALHHIRIPGRSPRLFLKLETGLRRCRRVVTLRTMSRLGHHYPLHPPVLSVLLQR